jgi:hypothetical protein
VVTARKNVLLLSGVTMTSCGNWQAWTTGYAGSTVIQYFPSVTEGNEATLFPLVKPV